MPEAGDRVPTEISHWEWDRTMRSPTELDTDLDSSVLVDASGDAVDDPNNANIQPAVYTAMDPEGVQSLGGRWQGPTGTSSSLTLTPARMDVQDDGPIATLAFKEKSVPFPDFEEPENKNKDNVNKNVYQVTIVVKDGTFDKEGTLHKDELNVTVKVINSTDDNQPGKVTFSNRQPEAKRAVGGYAHDPDLPTSMLSWQWYRGSAAVLKCCPIACVFTTPTTDDADADGSGRRTFIADTLPATIGMGKTGKRSTGQRQPNTRRSRALTQTEQKTQIQTSVGACGPR